MMVKYLLVRTALTVMNFRAVSSLSNFLKIKKMSTDTVRSACVFCKIVDGKESTEIIYQNDSICVFRDIRPAAKNHLLAVSREHLKDAKSLGSEHKVLVQSLIDGVKEGLKILGDDLSDVRYGFHWPPFHSVGHLHLHGISPAAEMGFMGRMIFRENSYWFVSPEYVMSRL